MPTCVSHSPSAVMPSSPSSCWAQRPVFMREVYSVRIRIPDSELQRLDGSQPIAGMPAGTFIATAPAHPGLQARGTLTGRRISDGAL